MLPDDQACGEDAELARQPPRRMRPTPTSTRQNPLFGHRRFEVIGEADTGTVLNELQLSGQKKIMRPPSSLRATSTPTTGWSKNAVRWSRQSAEAIVVQSFVVQQHALERALT